jgi:hypothetical protein
MKIAEPIIMISPSPSIPLPSRERKVEEIIVLIENSG